LRPDRNIFHDPLHWIGSTDGVRRPQSIVTKMAFTPKSIDVPLHDSPPWKRRDGNV
jgi:hypothetical protein